MLAQLLAGTEIREAPATPRERSRERRRGDRHEQQHNRPGSRSDADPERESRQARGEVEVLHRQSRPATQQPRSQPSERPERDHQREIEEHDGRTPHHPQPYRYTRQPNATYA